jgi:nicotinate-nucleotide adenylyltransferase
VCLLFGGSFNPIHHGHLIIARHVAETLDMARVILIPGARPPHKLDERLAPAAVRLAMCRQAVAGEPAFEVSDWELGRSGPNYTIDTVGHFQAALGTAAEVCWLIGMDSLHELHQWHRAAELVELCPLVTAARPGFAPPARETLAERFSPAAAERLLGHVVTSREVDISATEIRERVARGASIRYLVPEAVRAVIESEGLYRA